MLKLEIKCTSSGLLTVAGLLNVAEGTGGAAIEDSLSAEVITPRGREEYFAVMSFLSHLRC